jgi:hypothetical protein
MENPYSIGGQGGTGGVDDLEERKNRLLEYLRTRGASQVGYHALPLFGRGRSSHGGSDLPQAGLPQLTFNPFFSQVAGRSENFPQMPQGVSQAAMHAAQAGPGVGPGGAPQAPSQAPMQDPTPGVPTASPGGSQISPQPVAPNWASLTGAPRSLVGQGMTGDNATNWIQPLPDIFNPQPPKSRFTAF